MLLFTLLVTAIISILTYSVYYFSHLERIQVFDKRLRSRANYNTQLYSMMGGDSCIRPNAFAVIKGTAYHPLPWKRLAKHFGAPT